MNFDKEEEKVAKVLKSFQWRTPPESFMKDYEAEVLRKAHVFRPGLNAGGPGLLAIAFLLLLLGSFAFLIGLHGTNGAHKNQSVSAVPVKMSEPVQNKEEGRFQKIDQDLFILEMLGEDGGLIEDFEPVVTDVELMQQIHIPV